MNDIKIRFARKGECESLACLSKEFAKANFNPNFLTKAIRNDKVY